MIGKSFESIGNFPRIMLKMLGVLPMKNVSPDNIFSRSYLYGYKDKVSPDNILTDAFIDDMLEVKDKKYEEKSHAR